MKSNSNFPSDDDIASSRSHIMRGLENVMSGNSEEAISEFTRAIELNKNSEEAYGFRAGEYRKLEMWDKAISDYSRAIDLKESDNNYASRGCVFIMAEKFKEARTDLVKALNLNNNNDEAKQALALLESIGY